MKNLRSFAAPALLYLMLTTAITITKRPWCDEAWYGSPGYNLISKGYMGTTSLEPTGTVWKKVRLTGIDRHTYWAMPLHFLATAVWYKVFGFSILSLRALSIAWGLLALFCWVRIAAMLSAEPNAGLVTGLLLASNAVFINWSADGRMDIMAFAFASAAIAFYLDRRLRSITWAIAGSSVLATAAFFTHPNGGVLGFLGVGIFVLALDRRSLRWYHFLLPAIPLLVASAAWAVYIMQAPSDFKEQFGGATADRWIGLAHPWESLIFEIRQRYLEHYGFAWWAAAGTRAYSFILVAYAVAIAGSFWPRRASNPNIRVLALLTAAYFLYFTLLESYKIESYLLYTIPLFTVVLASSVCRFWMYYPSFKIAIAACLIVVAGLEIVRTSRTVIADRYHKQYLPVVAFLNQQPRPRLLFGPAELTWYLDSKDTLIDDLWLGCRSGKKADVIVLDDSKRDVMMVMATSAPDVYACQTKMLSNEFQKVYDAAGYVVWNRRL